MRRPRNPIKVVPSLTGEGINTYIPPFIQDEKTTEYMATGYSKAAI
jgi:hypothetical protein